MPYIKLTAERDVRKVFKKGEVISLDFDMYDVPEIIIVGRNGSGKSTLVNAIRVFKCDNVKKSSKSLYEGDNKMLLEGAFTVDTDFEKIFVVSSEQDDPLSMNNAYDACMFVDLGGFQTYHVSKGQRFQVLFSKFIKDNRDSFDSKTLVILDEPDNGFDLKTQNMMSDLPFMMWAKHECKFLVVSHSMMHLMKSLTGMVYDLEKREFVDGKEYIKEVTGLDIIVNRNVDNKKDDTVKQY